MKALLFEIKKGNIISLLNFLDYSDNLDFKQLYKFRGILKKLLPEYIKDKTTGIYSKLIELIKKFYPSLIDYDFKTQKVENLNKELDNIFLCLRNWLVVLHKTSYSKESNDSPILREKFKDIFAFYSSRVSLTTEETKEVFDFFNTASANINNFALVTQHGDYQPDNIYYNVGSGKIKVVDWEYAIIRGLPLVDFLNMLGVSAMALSCNNYYARWLKNQSRYMLRRAYVATTDTFRSIFYQHTEVSALVKKHVHAYCQELQINVHFLKILFLFYILKHNKENKDILKMFLQNNQNILWSE